MNTQPKPNLSFWQIWNMSFGFLGIQYGFGLQQANMSPIFRHLGAEESSLGLLWLAGPLTGLLVQPIVGALSDKTWTRFGRRKPYFLFGAILGSIAVLLMPYSPVLWVAAGLMWVLDGSMNMAMEPYRAFVGDKLNDNQRTLGFSVQTFMIAAGQILANLMVIWFAWAGFGADDGKGNGVPNSVKYSFIIGVLAMMITMAWTVMTTDEYPPDNLEEITKNKSSGGLIAWIKNIIAKIIEAFVDIFKALFEMPKAVRRIWWVKLFTWYGMPMMWQYLALSIARHCYNAPTKDSPNFDFGTQQVNWAYMVMNVVTVAMAFVIPTIVSKIGTRKTYALFLTIGGIGFISMLFTGTLYGVLAGMVLVGIGWSSIITIPFIMTTSVIPPSRTGVYMGLLNTFICIPQIIEMVTIGRYYDTLLSGDPRNALALAGVCLILGAVCCFFITNDVEPKNTDLA